jgi:hypothetical protein
MAVKAPWGVSNGDRVHDLAQGVAAWADKARARTHAKINYLIVIFRGGIYQNQKLRSAILATVYGTSPASAKETGTQNATGDPCLKTE